jgi:hypothetical protein
MALPDRPRDHHQLPYAETRDERMALPFFTATPALAALDQRRCG